MKRLGVLPLFFSLENLMRPSLHFSQTDAKRMPRGKSRLFLFVLG